MKKLYIYLVSILLTISSCQSTDDFLDVVPTGTTIPTTLEDHDKLLADYAILRSVALNIRHMDPDVYHTEPSFATIANRPVDVNAYTWQHQLFNNDGSDQDYNNYYYYIHVMNQILQDVDDAQPGGLPSEERNRIKAEAYAQRAFEYFLAINQYAGHFDASNPEQPGVPMPLEINLQAQLAKTSVVDVYTQILSDLTNALELLPEDYQAINSFANYRPGRASVLALLAEVHLFMGDFEAAKTYSNQALALYDFLYDYKEVDFNNPSNVWSGYAQPIRDQWYVGTLNQEVIWHRYNYWSFNNPIHLFSPSLEALYDKENNSRWYLFATQTSSSGVDVSPNFIFMYPSSERSIGMSVPRLMLTNAEAKARTNEGQNAIAIINELLANRISNFTPYTYTNDAAALELIKAERRKELVGTSINLFDQKRYHVYGDQVPTFTRTNPNTGEIFTLEPGSEGYYMDIAPSIKNLNPNLD